MWGSSVTALLTHRQDADGNATERIPNSGAVHLLKRDAPSLGDGTRACAVVKEDLDSVGLVPHDGKVQRRLLLRPGVGQSVPENVANFEWWDFDEDHEATLATEECGARARTRIRELFQEYSPRLNGDAGAQSGA